MAAPGSEELHKSNPGLGELNEVVLVKLSDGRSLSWLWNLSVVRRGLAGLSLSRGDKLLQFGQSPGSLVRLYLPSRPEVCEGGVALDFVLLTHCLMLGAVHLRNLNLLVLLEGLGQLVPGGSELLTVPTPGSVELDEGVSLPHGGSE